MNWNTLQRALLYQRTSDDSSIGACATRRIAPSPSCRNTTALGLNGTSGEDFLQHLALVRPADEAAVEALVAVVEARGAPTQAGRRLRMRVSAKEHLASRRGGTTWQANERAPVGGLGRPGAALVQAERFRRSWRGCRRNGGRRRCRVVEAVVVVPVAVVRPRR